MLRNLIISMVAVLYFFAGAANAENALRANKLEVGLALAMPTAGLSFRSVVNERRTVVLVLGSGVQAQINFTGDHYAGGYYLLGIGRDSTIGLIRAGYGYRWQKDSLSFHLEASLNIPFWDRELGGGLVELGKIAYLIPIGFGIHYSF